MNRSLPSARWSCSVGAFVAASVLVLTACNGGSTPSGTETTTASPTASATPTATPTPTPVYKPADATGKAQNVPVPVLPEAAKAETKEGLEAFAAYWYSALSYAYETGDTAPLEVATGPNCVFCKGLQNGVAAAWRDGRWVEGGTIETPSVTVQLSSGGMPQATIQVIQQQIGIHRSDGSLYQEPTKATNTASHAVATFGENGWKLTDLGLIR